MRILFMANNRAGLEILGWLKAQQADIVGLVVHPPDRQKYGEELIACSDLPEDRIFYGDQLRTPETLARIRALQPDIGLSIFFGYILRPEFIGQFPRGVVNLHPSLLPYNRGAHPNVWSIIDGTPAGATLHYIDAGIDTGAIIAQQEVIVEPVDTGKTLYGKLERASVQLFESSWPLIEAGRISRQPQTAEAGTSHRVRDLETLNEIDLDRSYTAHDLINLLRARTFPPYKGAYFTAEDGRRVYLQLDLTYETDSEEPENE